MKLLTIGIVVFVFVAMPLYALNTLVLPQLIQLKNTYAHSDDIANQAVGLTNQ